jgi:hypothetical protein
MATKAPAVDLSSQRQMYPGAQLPVAAFWAIRATLPVILLLIGLTTSDGEGRIHSRHQGSAVGAATSSVGPFRTDARKVNDERGRSRGVRLISMGGGIRRDHPLAVTENWQVESSPLRTHPFHGPERVLENHPHPHPFFADCERRVDSWWVGQAVYPGEITVPLNRTTIYRVSISVGSSSGQRQSSNEDMRVTDLWVRCGLGARLVALDSGLNIENEGNWILRRFEAFDTVEWTWNIRATQAGSAQIRIDFRPAIRTMQGGWVIPGNEDSGVPTNTLASNVAVETDVLETADNWFKADFPKMTGIAAVVGGALIALVTWVRRFLVVARGREDETVLTSKRSNRKADRRAQSRRRRFRR